jgi:hypothetical protein
MAPDPLLAQLLGKHRANGLLIDTNLLLLLVIGHYDRRRIESFKRTTTYTRGDFQRIGWLAEQFELLWTTPHILTEVDNLGRQLPQREWQGFAESLAKLTLRMKEEVVPSSSAMRSRSFSRLGLTDTVTISTKQQFLLLSDDLQLYLEAHRAGYDAINFNHLRN